MKNQVGSKLVQLPEKPFGKQLLRWYDAQKRDLPWRLDRSPYRVWVSEIMLQQTRVAVVLEYYQRFLKRFPTVQALAAAKESSVLAVWSGLGYYRRARALLAAAKEVVADRDGVFPATARELQQLPGIGPYTAAAIASIAFGEPVAVVDGNVERVLQRVTGTRPSRQALWTVAQDLLVRDRPGDFNQAMMELGATVCVPKQPVCGECPILKSCKTRGASANSCGGIRRKRQIHYALNADEDAVLLVQRAAGSSLMPNMWELPEIVANGHRPDLILKHSITVTDYTVGVVFSAEPAPEGRWIKRSRLPRLPLTGLTRKILRAAAII